MFVAWWAWEPAPCPGCSSSIRHGVCFTQPHRLSATAMACGLADGYLVGLLAAVFRVHGTTACSIAVCCLRCCWISPAAGYGAAGSILSARPGAPRPGCQQLWESLSLPVAADVVSKTVLQLLPFLLLPFVCGMSFAWWLQPPSLHLLILRCTWAEGEC